MQRVTPLRYVRPIQPVDFPSSAAEWEMPESKRHHRLCALLVEILRNAFKTRHNIGADQFVYYDASNPRRCLAPDAFIKLGTPDEDFASWKTWERGTPELCVEILSPSDSGEKLTWEQKLEGYHALGTRELVAFDIDAPVGERLRVWDRVAEDLVERVVVNEQARCVSLGLDWVVVAADEQPAALRLADHGVLLPTGEEAQCAAKEAALLEVARLEKLLVERSK